MKLRLAALALSGVLTAGACGSTVSPVDRRSAVPAGDDVEVSATAGDQPTAAGGEAAASRVTVGRTAGRPGSATAASSAPSSSGPALTSPIKVGYTLVDTAGIAGIAPNSEAAQQSSDASAAAAQAEMDALAKYANESGGVGGRKVEVVPFKISLNDGTDEAKMQQHCARATEDVKVGAFVDHSLYASEQGWACFAKHNTTFVGVVSGTDRGYLSTLRPYVATAWPTADRSTTALLGGLSAVKYFDGAKLGVIVDDSVIGNRLYDNVLVPGLRRLGVRIAEHAKINPADAGAAASQAASAVLRFNTSGITHVISLVSFYGYLAFTNQADSQAYYPRYAYGDFQGGAAVAAFYGSATQNRNSVAVSSVESYVIDADKQQERSLGSDVDRDEAPPGVRRCLDIYSKYTGKDYYRGNSGRSLSYAFYCDHFLLWLEAARKVGASLTPANWGNGLGQLGAYASTAMHSTEFTPGRFDGASSYRVGVYSQDARCRCFVATSGWLPLPG